MSRSHGEELLVLPLFQELITRNSRNKEQILMHEIKPEQLPLNHTLKTVWKVRVAGQVKLWKSEHTKSQTWRTRQSRTISKHKKYPKNTKPKKHSMEWERVSQWSSPSRMHQGGDIHIQSVRGWQRGWLCLENCHICSGSGHSARGSELWCFHLPQRLQHCLLPSFLTPPQPRGTCCHLSSTSSTPRSVHASQNFKEMC